MSTFEITLQRKVGGGWPAVSLFTRLGDRLDGGWELPVRREGCLQLDPADLLRHVTPKEYGAALGKALFRDELRDALAHARAQSRQACQRAGRNLTLTEWEQYFPGEQYHKTCDQWP